MSFPITPELTASAEPSPVRIACPITSPQPNWFTSPYSHHYAPQKPSPLASPPHSEASLSDASDASDADDDVSSSPSSCDSPLTPAIPISPWAKGHRRASESDYFSAPSRKIRFASLDFSPELNVPYNKPEGALTPLWRLDEKDEVVEEEPTLKVSFKSMKAWRARVSTLPLHSPPARAVSNVTVKRPSLVDAPMLRIATLRRNSSMLVKQFTVLPSPRRYRGLRVLIGSIALFLFLLVISHVEQSRYAQVSRLDEQPHAPDARPIFLRRLGRDERPLASPEQAAAEAAGFEPFRMSEQDELAALISYMTGTVANSLPPLNPSEPLDLQTILPFDPVTSTYARAEMDEIVLETWDQHPLLILGHMRDPLMLSTKRLLAKYRISPAPEFIELDQRVDAEHVESILTRLLGTEIADKPLVLLAGSVIGSNKELYELHKNGDLAGRVARVGIKMAPRLKKNKHAVFEERSEMERIRKPRLPAA